MIFVTVGTDNHDFSRLVKKIDEIAPRLKQKVIIQTGHTRYEPKNTEWFRFEKNETIEELYKKADIIVMHGGAGSIINSLKNNKIPIVVPRLKKYNEHVNDHQSDIAKELEKKKKVILIENLDEIETKIKKYRYRIEMHKKSEIFDFLENYLEKIRCSDDKKKIS